MNSIFFKDTSINSDAEVKEPQENQNLQEAGKFRYIMMHSRLYQIFEDAPSVKVCRA